MKQWLGIVGLVIMAVAVAVPAYATRPVAAPEIDPSMAVSGVSALVGGVLVLVGRRRRK